MFAREDASGDSGIEFEGFRWRIVFRVFQSVQGLEDDSVTRLGKNEDLALEMRDLTAQLVASFVLSRLDYCNVILAGLPDVSIRPLQRVLNTAARVVLGQGPRDSATAALKELHWLPVRTRVEYKLCLLTHRALNGTAPRYIRELLHPVADVVSRSHLRSASNGDLVPSTQVENLRTSVFRRGSTGMESSSGGTENNGRHSEI